MCNHLQRANLDEILCSVRRIADMTLELISRDEARALGLTRFFTGKPCINRHIAEQYTASGNCTQCCIERSRCEHRLPLTPLQQEQIRLQKERDTQAHERRLANIKLATARAEARLEAEKTKQAAKIERQRLVLRKSTRTGDKLAADKRRTKEATRLLQTNEIALPDRLTACASVASGSRIMHDLVTPLYSTTIIKPVNSGMDL